MLFSNDEPRRRILIFIVLVLLIFILLMTKFRFQHNVSSLSTNLFSSNKSYSSHCYDVVKPFFRFLCSNNSSNSIPLPINRKKHVCDEFYSTDQEPNLFTRLYLDFQPFQNWKIRLLDIENLSNSCLKCHHIQIIDNKLYHIPRENAFIYETRSRSVKLLIKHMMDTFSDLPDLDLFFSVQDVVDLKSEELNNILFKVPIFGFTKTNWTRIGLRSDAIILMPCFTFWSWPEVRVGRWTKIYQSILDISHKIEYDKRIPKLFWRGVDSWKRDWFINMTSKYSDILDVNVINWNKNVDGLSYIGSNAYTSLEQHCHYKYLAHLEGNTYSARLKYILLCGSPVVNTPIQYWQEYWYHLLIDRKNIIMFEANRNESVLNRTLDILRYNESFIRQIGQQGQWIVKNYLNEHAVTCYWWKLLQEYSKLFAYKPTLHPNAVYIDDFILSKSS
ncbi:hypothetical protein I4U23_000134 [Adineta vaga]|nr:hypothetical protein I4U23_000134 [Adineta vaga]